MTMDYFRRPVLAGKNIQLTTFATVRGSKRRSNPDGTSTVPYFPGVSATQTLNITHQAGSVSVALTGNSLSTVLADINTSLGVNGVARDADGSIEIVSSVAGSAGLVRVTGGTAAVNLGFQTFAGGRPLEARGGQVPSSPESRTNNPYDSSFLSRGENFTAESMQRGLSRLASNGDVLWSELSKEGLGFKTVSFVASSGGEYLTLTASERVFVSSASFGGLTASSEATDLIQYFQLIDTATGLLAPSRVIGVVRGAQTGLPPFPNSPNWADTTGNNILGLDQIKVGSATINSITEGRFVECSGATFISSGVRAGDYVQISNATNLTKWSNNGKRWIVESVVSETVLSLKPMSKTEIVDILSGSVTDIQPIVELNDNVTGGEVFGDLTVSTGPFAHNVTLVVRPPIPSGATYELRAAVPLSLRDSVGITTSNATQALLGEYAAENPVVHNGTISGLVASPSGGDVAVSAGVIRWNGHIHNIPATTVLNSSLTNGLNYLFWDDTTLSIQANTSAAAFGSLFNPGVSSNKGHPLAVIVRLAGSITAIIPAGRLVADAARTVTVGAVGAQFSTLDDALHYVSAFSTAFTEGSSTNGSFPHFEIVLTGNTTYSGGSAFFPTTVPSVTIRGVSKQVQLTLTSGLRFDTARFVEIRDLRVASSGVTNALVRMRTPTFASSVKISNVEQTSGAFPYVVISEDGGLITDVAIESSKFSVSSGVTKILPASLGTGTISVLFSDITATSPVAAPQLFSDQGLNTWSGGRLFVKGCRFLGGWITTSSTDALFVSTDGVGADSDIVVEDSVVDLGAHTSGSNAILFNVPDGATSIHRVTTQGGQIPRFAYGNVSIFESNVTCNPEDQNVAIFATRVIDSIVTGTDTDALEEGGYGVSVLREASGNTISGRFISLLLASGDDCLISNNIVTMLSIGNALPMHCIRLESGLRNIRIVGNTVTTSSRPSPIAAPFGIRSGGGVEGLHLISSNQIVVPENGFGISVGDPSGATNFLNLRIESNVVIGTTTSGGFAVGIGLYGDGTDVQLLGNYVSIVQGGTAGNGCGIFAGEGSVQDFRIIANTVKVSVPYGATDGVLFIDNPLESQIVQGNRFEGSTVSQRVSGLSGTTTGNQFIADTTFLLSNVSGNFLDNFVDINSVTGGATIGSGKYDGNVFNCAGINTSISTVGIEFSNNYLSGNFNGGAGSLVSTVFSGNKVEGSGGVILGNSSASKVIAVGNYVTTNFLVNTGSGNVDSVVSNNVVLGNATIASNSTLLVSDCVFRGTGTHTITISGSGVVRGCRFLGNVVLDGLGTNQRFESNHVVGANVAFTGDVTAGFFSVTGNTITPPGFTTNAIQFPSYTTGVDNRFIVQGNHISLGNGTTAVRASGVRFAGDVHNLSVVGNNFQIYGSFDPGGTGALTFSALTIAGAGSTDGVVFSSNYVDKPNNLSFRTGALTIEYKAISIPSTNTVQVGGAGSCIFTSGTAAATVGHRGEAFFYVGPGAYSL